MGLASEAVEALTDRVQAERGMLLAMQGTAGLPTPTALDKPVGGKAVPKYLLDLYPVFYILDKGSARQFFSPFSAGAVAQPSGTLFAIFARCLYDRLKVKFMQIGHIV